MKHAFVLVSLLFFSLNAFAETDFAYRGLSGFNNLTSFVTLQLMNNLILQIILVIAVIIAVLFFLFKKGFIRRIGEERVMESPSFGEEKIEEKSEEETPEITEEELPEEVPEEPAEKEPEIEKPFKEKAPIDRGKEKIMGKPKGLMERLLGLKEKDE
ncbi:MAG: hypothetical protein ABIE23_00780 [archaeon]